MKYFIIPKPEFQEEILADSKEDALIQFATNMEMDMNIFFHAVTEEELENIKIRSDYDAHDRVVKSFMADELASSFGLPDAEAVEVAEFAYEEYCKGDGRTEYQCIEDAYNEYTTCGIG